MKQSSAWLISILASGAIFGGVLAVLFSATPEKRLASKPLPAESPLEAPTSPSSSAAPEPGVTMSPDDP